MAAVLSIELMQPISLGITLAAQAVPASEPWGAAEGCCNSIDTRLMAGTEYWIPSVVFGWLQRRALSDELKGHSEQPPTDGFATDDTGRSGATLGR